MKQARLLLAALLLLPLASGCTTAPARQNVPFPSQSVEVTRGDLARIYFVRSGWVGIVEDEVRVFDGDTEIGGLTPSTFLCWERPGGRSVGRVTYDRSGPGRGELEGYTDLDCPAGSAYYFQVTVEREGGDPTVQPIDREEGRRLVAERKPAKGD